MTSVCYHLGRMYCIFKQYKEKLYDGLQNYKKIRQSDVWRIL